MADVLAQEPGRSPTWVWVVGALVAAGVVGLAIQHTTRPAGPEAAPSPSASALPSAGKVGSACGGDIDLPLVDAIERPTNTGLRLLVGGRDARVVAVDDGTSYVLPWHDPDRA